jgi:Lrp/AsnC family leucine-responsive transcriptional regulator
MILTGCRRASTPEKEATMDSTDIKILRILHENARENASVISDRINMSVSAVIERIRKLETQGIIKGYTAILNEEMIGNDVLAYIYVGTEHPKYNEDFILYVQDSPSIVECNFIAGDQDFILKVSVPSIRDLQNLLNEIKSVKGVSYTRTSIALSTVKNQYTVCP